VEVGTIHLFFQALAASTVPKIFKGSTLDPTLIKVLIKTLLPAPVQDPVIIEVSTKHLLAWVQDLGTLEDLISLQQTVAQDPTITKVLTQLLAQLSDLITTISPRLAWVQHMVTKEVSTRVLVKAVQDQTIVEGLIQVLLTQLLDKQTIEDSTLALVEVLMQRRTEEEDDSLILGLEAPVKDILPPEMLVETVREVILPQVVEVPRALKEAIQHLMQVVFAQEVTLLQQVKATKEAILQLELFPVKEVTIRR